MRVLLLGSTGKIGSLLLKNLLEKEINIKALVRDDSRLKSYNNNFNLKIIKGNFLDYEILDKSLEEVDCVVSCLGHKKSTPRFFQKQIFEMLIEIMRGKNIKRIITLTGSGVFLDNDSVSILDRLFLLPIKIIDPKRIEDGQAHAEILSKTDLDWTIIRTPVHVNFGTKYFVHESLDGSLNLFVNRFHIVQFMSDLIINQKYIRKAPVISSSLI